MYIHMCWNVHSGGPGPGPAQAGVLVGQQGAAVVVSTPPHSWRSKQETRDSSGYMQHTLDCV